MLFVSNNFLEKIMILTDKKQIKRLIFLLSLTYMVSYITRINYGAIISEMERATEMSREMLSLALTGSFITYGAGQIISGFFGDKFSPKRLVFIGLGVSALMNILIPFCQNQHQLLFVWCINGFAQAFMWPPMVRIMAISFSTEDYKQASVKVSWGSSIGSIVVYLVSPIIIAFLGWRSVFWTSALAGVVMMILWNRFCIDSKPEPKSSENKTSDAHSRRSHLPAVLIGIMLAIVLQGMLRDGVTTWMPSYISETYNISNVISILTSVVLPIFSIISFSVASKLYSSTFKNPLTCAGVIFGLGAVSSFALFLMNGKNAVFSIAFSAILTGCMHGVNLMLVCMVPPYFKKYGNVSTVSGVINSCTYIGSAISTYGIALISKTFDWKFTVLTWFLIAMLGTIVCFVCVRPWKNKMEK